MQITCSSVKNNIASVCAWCPDKDARTAEAQAQGFQVSHGLCRSCADKQMMEFLKPIKVSVKRAV